MIAYGGSRPFFGPFQDRIENTKSITGQGMGEEGANLETGGVRRRNMGCGQNQTGCQCTIRRVQLQPYKVYHIGKLLADARNSKITRSPRP